MKKKNFVFAFVLVMCILTSYGKETSASLFSTRLVSDGVEVSISDNFPADLFDIIIPKEIDGQKVVAIAQRGFSTPSIKSITIPEGVTKIGGLAFSVCQNLTSVSIPESVKEIEYGAFNHCSSLTNISIPRNVTIIRGRAFYGCQNLSSVSIPESVTKIGHAAFPANCKITRY